MASVTSIAETVGLPRVAALRCLLVMPIIANLSSWSPVRDQDIVYFSHARAKGETRLIGEVVDYKGKQLEIRVEGQVRTMPAEQVRRIEFRKHALHAEGDKLFAAHDFAE